MTDLAQQVVDTAVARGRTVATAESLTGGLLSAALTSVPGSSAVFRGGAVTYATDLKHQILGVDAQLLSTHSAVDADVAAAMAVGAATLCGADLGVATTGVAGPADQDGRKPGTVYIAVHDRGAETTAVEHCSFVGSREAIRTQTVATALGLLLSAL